MGRYSRPLAEQYVDLVGVGAGDRVLDVGCGPGVLTEPLVERCGADVVAAVDPSPSFVDAMRVRFPGLDRTRTYRLSFDAPAGLPRLIGRAGTWEPVSLPGSALADVGIQLPVLEPEQAILMRLR